MKFASKRGYMYGMPGFTLREILVIVVVISVGLMAIVSLLTYSINYVQKSRERVVAINLAREGIEAMYQIRDTNRQRRAGMKDACRLKVDPLLSFSAGGCSNDEWVMSGGYILQTRNLSGQQYFLLSGTQDVLDISNIDTGDLTYSLCLSGASWFACPGMSGVTAEGRYFREIRGYGLFLKDINQTGGQELICLSGASAICGGPEAKEFRFCSRVVYVGYGTGEVNLCGVITNFRGK